MNFYSIDQFWFSIYIISTDLFIGFRTNYKVYYFSDNSMILTGLFVLQTNTRMKAMRRQLDEAEEEISREKAHRRKVNYHSSVWNLA